MNALNSKLTAAIFEQNRTKVAIEAKRTAIMDSENLTGHTSDGIEVEYDGMNIVDVETGYPVYIGGLVTFIHLETE